MSGRADKRDDHWLCGARSLDAQTEGRGQDDPPRLHGELRGSSQSSLYHSFTHILQTLYESSTALGFRKSTQIETGKEIKMEKMETLIRENRELKQEGGKKGIVSLSTIFPTDRKPES